MSQTDDLRTTGTMRLLCAATGLTGLLLALLLVVLGTGCGTEQDAPSRTALARTNPEAAALLVRAQNSFEAGDYGAALSLADEAAQQVPELPHVHFLRGRILTVLQQYDPARAAYERVLALDPTFEGVRFNLGNNAYRQDQYEEALRLFEAEQRRHPSPTNLLHMARAYAELNRFEEAYQHYQQVLATDEANATVHAELGQLYEDEGEIEEALTHSRRAVALEPANVRYRYALGLQELQANHPQEAVEALQPVVEAEPWNPGAHNSLGQALLRLGRPDEAQHYLGKVDSLQTQSRQLLQMERSAALTPEEPIPWIELGNAYRRAGRLAPALDAYRMAQPLMPQNLSLQNNIANLAHLLGRTQEAIAGYEALLQQDSTLVSVWVNLGVARAETGDTSAARAAWQQALRYDPGNTLIQRYLASLDAP